MAFRQVKRIFTEAPIIQHLDPAQPNILQIDATGFAITGILTPYDVFWVVRPVKIYPRKCSPAENNSHTYDLELFAMVQMLNSSGITLMALRTRY